MILSNYTRYISSVGVICFMITCLIVGSLLIYKSSPDDLHTQDKTVEGIPTRGERPEGITPTVFNGILKVSGDRRNHNKTTAKIQQKVTSHQPPISTGVLGNGYQNETAHTHSVLMVLSGMWLLVCGTLSCSCLVKFSSKEYSSHQRSSQAFKPDAHLEDITTHRLLQDVTDQSPDYAVKSLLEEPWQYEDRRGHDTKGLQHKGMKVRTIHRVVNEKLKKQYDKEADATLISPYPEELIKNPIRTTRLKLDANDSGCNRSSIGRNIGRGSQAGSESDLPSELTDKDEVKETRIDMDEEESLLPASFLERLNPGEVYLLHGTKLENIPSILKTGFDLGRARTGLYGRAIYLAESSEKVDQYTDYASNRRDTDLAMLVVRVKLGRILCHLKEKKVNMSYKGFLSGRKPKYETVVAGHTKRFREFLVFNQKLIYPEFVVVYDRVH